MREAMRSTSGTSLNSSDSCWRKDSCASILLDRFVARAGYGTLIAWAEELGLEDAVLLLQETLEEEKTTDETLTDIAKTAVNQQAEAA